MLARFQRASGKIGSGVLGKGCLEGLRIGVAGGLGDRRVALELVQTLFTQVEVLKVVARLLGQRVGVVVLAVDLDIGHVGSPCLYQKGSSRPCIPKHPGARKTKIPSQKES